MNGCQSTKADPQEKKKREMHSERKRMKKKRSKRGNKGESDLGNNMDENSLDALLHSRFPSSTTNLPTRQCLKRCDGKEQTKAKTKKKKEKRLFLLMNKGNFILCLSFRITLSTLCINICYSLVVFLLQFTSEQETGKREEEERAEERENVEKRMKRRRRRKKKARKAQRILFFLLFPSQSSLIL